MRHDWEKRDFWEILDVESRRYPQHPWTSKDLQSALSENNTVIVAEYPRHEEIAARAWKIYEESGRIDGRSKENWSQAECELRKRIVAFMVYKFAWDHVVLQKLVVDPWNQEQGIEGQLLAFLEKAIKENYKNLIDMHVRETNVDAQLSLQSQGFRALRVLRGHFEDTGEDAYLFQKHIKD